MEERSNKLDSLEAIEQEIYRFKEKAEHDPVKIHLTEDEIESLNTEARESLIRQREHDLEERLCPDLLPPARTHQNITYNDYICGLQIIKSNTSGHLSS